MLYLVRATAGHMSQADTVTKQYVDVHFGLHVFDHLYEPLRSSDEQGQTKWVDSLFQQGNWSFCFPCHAVIFLHHLAYIFIS